MKIGHATAPSAIRPATTRDLDWAAGFLEGEGSFVWGNGSENVVASQVEQEPLLRLRTIFGGSVSQYRRGRFHHSKWFVSGSRARGVALTLYLLMTAKRQQQIRVALAQRKPPNQEPMP